MRLEPETLTCISDAGKACATVCVGLCSAEIEFSPCHHNDGGGGGGGPRSGDLAFKNYSSSHRLNSLGELAYPVPVTVLLLFGSEALQLETCDHHFALIKYADHLPKR